MFGEFFREAGVLVIVFGFLEAPSREHWRWVLGVSTLALTLGMLIEVVRKR